MVLLLAAALVGAAPEGHTACKADRAALLAMDVGRFDQGASGWRSVGEKHGCELAGAALVRDYLAVHRATLTAQQREQLGWHLGQLLATGGNRAGAIRVFAGLSDPEPAQRWYRGATLAFLRRDKAALIHARSKLAALLEPPDFAAAAATFKRRFGQEIVWPENLDIVDALIRCYDSDYGTAYANACPRHTRPSRPSGRSRS